MSIQYNVSSNGDRSVLSAVIDGTLYTADSDHTAWNTILNRVLTGTATAEDFDTSLVIGRRFEGLSERVSVADGKVFFDGDPVDNSLTRHIIRMVREGYGFRPFVRFLENLYQNPSPHSREHLYRWVSDRDLTITEDGCFIGYKGVTSDYKSINSGPGIVNGMQAKGQLDNSIGNVIELPRSKVTFDAAIGCAAGLHVGTYEYAHSFARGALLKVKVNPRDVVSVPTDCSGEKMRVCRYEVLDTIDAPETVPVLWDDQPWDVDDDEYDAQADRDERGVVDFWNVSSESDPSVFYTIVEYHDGERTCTCPGFKYRDVCKHI